MKFIHISDLHIGKRLGEIPLLADQKHILRQICTIVTEEKPDAVFIAGDVYDKSVPPTEAVSVFDDFLVNLAELNVQVFIISGNHDSPERLSFGNRLMKSSGIHISSAYSGSVSPFVMKDEFGNVNIYMMPFVKPANVRSYFPDEDIFSYTDALQATVREMHINTGERNVLIAHQFVAGASKSGSEIISVGGSENVDPDVFADFNYVALGHIHGAQFVEGNKIRYCGTPLKYSLSECSSEKSVTVGTIDGEGNVELSCVPLVPLHEMVRLKGKFDEIATHQRTIGTTLATDYVYITLTDEDDVPDASMRLRKIYPNLVSLDYDNTRMRSSSTVHAAENIEEKSPLTLFSDFFRMQNGSEMSEEQTEFVRGIIEDIWRNQQ